MDHSFFDEINRKLDSIRNPYGIQSIIDQYSNKFSFDHLYPDVLNHPIGNLVSIIEKDNQKWEGLRNSAADVMAFRNSLVHDWQPDILKAIKNFETPYLALPPEILAQREFIDSYLEKLRPAGYKIDHFKEYSVQTNSDEIIRFEYNLDITSETEEIDIPREERTIVKGAKHVRDVIHQLYLDDSKLLMVDPRDFEKVIAELMYKQGFEVELTKQTRDGGKDIIALRTIAGIPMKFLVECKRWRDKVDIDVVSRFYDVVVNVEKANKGIICTTSSFTSVAHQRRQLDPWRLDFMDREDILKWVSDYTLGKM